MSSTWLVSIAVVVCAAACSKKPPAYKSNVATVKIENRTISAAESGKPDAGTVIARRNVGVHVEIWRAVRD